MALIFSIPQKAQDMDSFSENLNKKSTALSDFVHLDKGATDPMDQDKSKCNHDQPNSTIKYRNLNRSVPMRHEMSTVTYETNASHPYSNFGFSLIESSSRILNAIAEYTIAHPVQAVMVCLASQVELVEAAGADTGSALASCACCACLITSCAYSWYECRTCCVVASCACGYCCWRVKGLIDEFQEQEDRRRMERGRERATNYREATLKRQGYEEREAQRMAAMERAAGRFDTEQGYNAVEREWDEERRRHTFFPWYLGF